MLRNFRRFFNIAGYIFISTTIFFITEPDRFGKQKFAGNKGKLMQQERRAYTSSVTKADSLLHEKNYATYNNELNNYRDGIIKNNPTSMMAALLSAMKEPVYPSVIPVTRQDSVNNYNEYKKHFWDGITFMDDRIIRTPFFLKKLERYYREVILPEPDTIIRDVDYKLLLARSAPEMYKFLLNWITDEYINPKYMGQDAVFVHLFEKYHSKGISSWLNEKQLTAISNRAYMLMSNLIGEKAADLDMVDSTGKPTPLYSVNSAYTVICFWDPNCGHCKIELPRLDSIYQASWKDHGVKIYAVFTPDDKNDTKTDWVNYIKANHLSDWTHVYQTKESRDLEIKNNQPGFRQLYDARLTPTLYLLDENKRIIAKQLSIEQFDDFITAKLKNPTTK